MPIRNRSRVSMYVGDCRAILDTLPEKSVHCVVTSPPYYGLRDYGHDDQIGLESTPEGYVMAMVDVFAKVHRVLRDDGTLWLNLGDSYNAAGRATQPSAVLRLKTKQGTTRATQAGVDTMRPQAPGLKQKDLIGIPWRVAFALQEWGWYLRQDIVWSKPNPMPESVEDRCTRAHEYIFLLSKRPKYYYDREAIADPALTAGMRAGYAGYSKRAHAMGREATGNERDGVVLSNDVMRNKRSVWTVTTEPYEGAHFAVFPPRLIEPCILAGTSAHGCCAACGAPWSRIVERDDIVSAERNALPSSSRTFANAPQRSGVYSLSRTRGWRPTCECGPSSAAVPCKVLDPFAGSGTTGFVADHLGRAAVLIDLNPDYVAMSNDRTHIRESLLRE
jgi:DNA modification methylase